MSAMKQKEIKVSYEVLDVSVFMYGDDVCGDAEVKIDSLKLNIFGVIYNDRENMTLVHKTHKAKNDRLRDGN